MASPRTDYPRIGGAIPRISWKTVLAVLVILGLTGWSVAGTKFDLIELLTSSGPIERFVSGMFPPDLSAVTLRTTAIGIIETFQMSFLGALIGAIVAFPLAALATGEAARIGASRGERLLKLIPYHVSRLVLNVFRSVPDILWALVFVVALGLGPFPGTLALAVHSTGILGKLYSETLEAVPQAMSGFTSLTLYQWECNIRSATILGFVGAGGIGQQILVSMNLFNYPKVATLVGATIIVVLLVDRFSAAVRRRLVY
jgi:phosphonate transport system permease protein